MRCNSFDGVEKVIHGHDAGAAVWIQGVEIQESERILAGDVEYKGTEISVEKVFFDRVLKPKFVERFDSDMPVNKYRYSYAFDDAGRYLKTFEEDILEPNFFTREQMRDITFIIREVAEEGSGPGETKMTEDVAEQMIRFAEYINTILEESADCKYFSVMS